MMPPVASPFGSTPGMVVSRSSSSDAPLQFGAEQPMTSADLFPLSRSETEGWKVGKGWVYCGLKKVDVEEAAVGQNPSAVYLNVTADGGEFTAVVSPTKDDKALVSFVLYLFEDGELKTDGRYAPFIPLYN